MFRLDGKLALITGGSRGLGLQIAEGYLSQGARVILTARKADDLHAATRFLLQRLDGVADRIHTRASDLQDIESIPETVEAMRRDFGELDILVNNAGTSWGAPMEEHPLEAWEKVMRLNITAPFVLTQAVGRQSMIPRRQGKIVNIASISGLAGNAAELEMRTIAYNASKGAMVNFTRTLAAEWGRYNINVNALCPGFFATKLSEKVLESVSERVLPTVPLKRFGGERDLMGPAVFFASEDARHVTGTVLAVDGGVMATS